METASPETPHRSSFDLSAEDQSVLITGAARGLGRALAKVFGSAGYRVAVIDIDAAAAEATVSELTDQGHLALSVPADVTDSAQVEKAFRAVEQRWGTVDVVINNAGVLGPAAPIEELEDEAIDHVMSIDLRAPMLVCRQAVRSMRATGRGGSILNIASITADTGAAAFPAYSAAKAGVIALTRSLARRVGRYRIRVNCLRPGSILGTRFLETSRGKGLAPRQRLELKAGLMQKIPLGRAAECQDIAHVALFLASPLARHIHGAILTVDGGEALGSQ